MNKHSYFQGSGPRPDQRLELPRVARQRLRDGAYYLASTDLANAVNVALTLRIPLLLTGEPGSGKSRLANRIAWELRLNRPSHEPFEFVIKSDTRGADLFYGFDTVGRFHAAQIVKQTEKEGDIEARIAPQRFITFNALGRAILYAKPKSFLTRTLELPDYLDVVKNHPGERPDSPSVVLIDEIDKAPRDVPNDILTEIENMRFRIPEFEIARGEEVHVALEEEEQDRRPIVIITSNSEKALPDAFMRRCAYFNLESPPFRADGSKTDDEVTVEDIIESRLGKSFGQGDRFDDLAFLTDCVAFLRYLRVNESLALGRKPAMAEFIDWLRVVLPDENGSDIPGSLNDLRGAARDRFIDSIRTTLLKEPRTQGRAEEIFRGFGQWKTQDDNAKNRKKL
uniref:MoxR-like ATPase n=1 Tax=Candidatus Kentrum sp. TC TaxID=2126339 RepID=A0A450YEC0_9GAMM|nr:MAG: MoxR-like ATPase [Candidatus Kentron sp. TC]